MPLAFLSGYHYRRFKRGDRFVQLYNNFRKIILICGHVEKKRPSQLLAISKQFSQLNMKQKNIFMKNPIV